MYHIIQVFMVGDNYLTVNASLYATTSNKARARREAAACKREEQKDDYPQGHSRNDYILTVGNDCYMFRVPAPQCAADVVAKYAAGQNGGLAVDGLRTYTVFAGSLWYARSQTHSDLLEHLKTLVPYV